MKILRIKRALWIINQAKKVRTGPGLLNIMAIELAQENRCMQDPLLLPSVSGPVLRQAIIVNKHF